MKQQVFDDFIEEFNKEVKQFQQGDTENVLFGITKEFKQHTGGRLSHYDSPRPVVSIILRVIDGNGKIGVVGVERGIPPMVGGIAFPGGFVDEGEDAETAALRELQEEINFDYDISPKFKFLGTFNTNNNLLLFMVSEQVYSWEALKESFIPNDEVPEIFFLDSDSEMCFTSHTVWKNKVISGWFNN